MRLCVILRQLSATTLVYIVRGYQAFVSPLLGHHCRFRPTCSQYLIDAVRKHGPVGGTLRGAWRICRCHPFARGGDDPP
jgi:putative membrane protein insertion efficiency factor